MKSSREGRVSRTNYSTKRLKSIKLESQQEFLENFFPTPVDETKTSRINLKGGRSHRKTVLIEKCFRLPGIYYQFEFEPIETCLIDIFRRNHIFVIHRF